MTHLLWCSRLCLRVARLGLLRGSRMTRSGRKLPLSRAVSVGYRVLGIVRNRWMTRSRKLCEQLRPQSMKCLRNSPTIMLGIRQTVVSHEMTAIRHR